MSLLASECVVPLTFTGSRQVWRLFGNFFYFGDPSFNWLIRMIMLYVHCLNRKK